MTAREKPWIDSGYDCDHCGGQILRPNVRRPTRPTHSYYRCQQCGCEWTIRGEVARIGRGESCQEAQNRRRNTNLPENASWYTWLAGLPRWVQIVGGGVLFLVLLRFGGLMLFRILLPLALLVIMGYLILRYGQEREWW